MCVEVSINARAAATHAGMHVRDTRGLYQCHKCDQHWRDLYLLASHFDRCKGTGRAGFARSCLRVELDTAVDEPMTILVARSSDGTPKTWFSRCEFVEEGLPNSAADRLKEYKLDFGIEGDLPTFFHAGCAISSRHLPADKHHNATSTTSSAMQKSYRSESMMRTSKTTR